MPSPTMKDALLKVTKALPNGAASTTSSALDLGMSANGQFLAQCELLVTVPALSTAQQPDAKVQTYFIVESDNSDLSSPVVVCRLEKLTQTGAGGAGAAGATQRYRPSTNSKRYIGVKSTGSAAGDASGVSMTAELLF